MLPCPRFRRGIADDRAAFAENCTVTVDTARRRRLQMALLLPDPPAGIGVLSTDNQYIITRVLVDLIKPAKTVGLISSISSAIRIAVAMVRL